MATGSSSKQTSSMTTILTNRTNFTTTISRITTTKPFILNTTNHTHIANNTTIGRITTAKQTSLMTSIIPLTTTYFYPFLIIASLQGHTNQVVSIVLLKNGYLASASEDKTIKIWNLKNYSLVRTLVGHSAGVWSLCVLSNDLLASGSNDKTIKIWDSTNGLLLNTLIGHKLAVRSLALLNNGYLASGSYDKTVKIWNVTTGSNIFTLVGHTNIVYSVIQLKNGYLASSSADTNIIFWNIKNGSLISTLKVHTFVTCLLELKNNQLLSGSASENNPINIWNQNKSTLNETFSNLNGIWSLGQNLNTSSLIIGDQYGNLTIRNSTYSTLLSFQAHSSFIYSLLILPITNYIITASADFSIKIWSINIKF